MPLLNDLPFSTREDQHKPRLQSRTRSGGRTHGKLAHAISIEVGESEHAAAKANPIQVLFRVPGNWQEGGSAENQAQDPE